MRRREALSASDGAIAAVQRLVIRAAAPGGPDLVRMSFDDLAALLEPDGLELVREVARLDVARYGCPAPRLDVADPPADLLALSQPHPLRLPPERWPTQYAAPHIHAAFCALDEALAADTGLHLLLNSGYRSPAHQALTFAWYLTRAELDVAATLRRALPPAYSEHCQPNHAIDLDVAELLHPRESFPPFETTEHYRWLQENAARFGFVESYRPGNTAGVAPEPWHWRLQDAAVWDRKLASRR